MGQFVQQGFVIRTEAFESVLHRHCDIVAVVMMRPVADGTMIEGLLSAVANLGIARSDQLIRRFEGCRFRADFAGIIDKKLFDNFALNLMCIENRPGSQEGKASLAFVAGRIVNERLRDRLVEDNLATPSTGFDALGTTLNSATQLLPLVECPPPSTLKTELLCVQFEQEWIDAGVTISTLAIGRSPSVR